MSAIYHIGGTAFVNLRCVAAAIGPSKVSDYFQYRVYTTDGMGAYHSDHYRNFHEGGDAFQKFIDAWKAAND